MATIPARPSKAAGNTHAGAGAAPGCRHRRRPADPPCCPYPRTKAEPVRQEARGGLLAVGVLEGDRHGVRVWPIEDRDLRHCKAWNQKPETEGKAFELSGSACKPACSESLPRALQYGARR